MDDDTGILPSLLSISKTVRQLVSIKLSDCGVAPGQDQFLLCFADREELPIARIAERLAVRPSTVSKMADILTRRGWVCRKSDAEDGRRVTVHLTETGYAMRETVRTLQVELEGELWRAVGQDDALKPCLAKVDQSLQQRLRRLR